MKYLVQYLYYHRALNDEWTTDYSDELDSDELALRSFTSDAREPGATHHYRLVRLDNPGPDETLTYLADRCHRSRVGNPDFALSHDILHKGCTMPTPTPIPQSQIDPNERMVSVSVKREASNGSKLFLYINAQKLHDTLSALGVPKTGNRFENRPVSRTAIADASFNLSTDVFLTAEYPAKYDLSQVFANPPSLSNLKRMCNSSFDAVRRILEHYQPIDISVEIQKKAVR